MDLLDSTTVKTDPPRSQASGSAPLLVYIYPAGPNLGSCLSLRNPKLVIGRDPDCDIRVHHPSVSRRHAHVERRKTGYCIEDLQSTNGTFLNDVPVSCSPLHEGDYVRVGSCIFRYLAGDNVEAEYHEELYRLTIVDALTNVANKRHLLEFLDRELARTERYGRPLSVVLFDIDHFKALNDRLGHLAGDFALRELSALVQVNVRRDELLARYGGEEFCLVLPETSREAAVAACDRLRELVAAHPFHYEGQPFHLTLSMGVTTTAGEVLFTPHDVLLRADNNLYAAKNRGRNQVVA
jgi:diguanylate cyclase (GGDEF)-like protein